MPLNDNTYYISNEMCFYENDFVFINMYIQKESVVKCVFRYLHN